MNTANLQLEGLYLLLGNLLAALADKSVLTRREIDGAIARAEAAAAAEAGRLSPANLDAVLFPMRLIRTALDAPPGGGSFSTLAARVGETKSDSPGS